MRALVLVLFVPLLVAVPDGGSANAPCASQRALGSGYDYCTFQRDDERTYGTSSTTLTLLRASSGFASAGNVVWAEGRLVEDHESYHATRETKGLGSGGDARFVAAHHTSVDAGVEAERTREVARGGSADEVKRTDADVSLAAKDPRAGPASVDAGVAQESRTGTCRERVSLEARTAAGGTGVAPDRPCAYDVPWVGFDMPTLP